MGQLLEILGRGVQVETADLIWQWLEQANEVLAGSDPSHAQNLDKIIKSAFSKNPSNLTKRLKEYRLMHPGCHYADLAEAAQALSDNRVIAAFKLLKSVYSRYPSNVTTLYSLGHCSERLGRETEAIAFYQDCLKFKNYLIFPRQRLAAIYFKNGQIEKTISEYQQIVTEYPDDLSLLLTLGHLYIACGHYKSAIDTFSTAILIQPDYFCPDTDPIDSLMEAGSFYDALTEIETALAEHPDRPDLLLRRASVFALLGQPDQALDHYNHTISVYPDFLEANIKLGSHYVQIEKPMSAAVQYAHAAHINDRLVDAYLGMATAQKMAGMTSEALVSLSLGAAIETSSPILFAEATRLTLPNDNDKQSINFALNSLNQTVKSQPHNPQIHYRLGTLLMSVGRFGDAIELFTKALELNPLFSQARNNLAVGLYENDEKALALEYLTPPSCLQKEIIELYYKVAILYCNKIEFAFSLLNLEQRLEETFYTNDMPVNIALILQILGLENPSFLSIENYKQTADC